MKNAKTCREAIKSGLNFLEAKQLPTGGFASSLGYDQYCFTDRKLYRTTFFPSLIACAINRIARPEAKKLHDNIANFLLSQLSTDWSFNYWYRNCKTYLSRPYPNDLDDTFCALATIHDYDSRLLDGKALASIAQLLFTTETKPGGPYNTWIIGTDADKSWHDIDPVVNANVAYFLSKQGIVLPGLTDYLETCIRSKGEPSKYYTDVCPILYFISKSYTGRLSKDIIAHLLNTQANAFWENSLHATMSITTLVRSGYGYRRLRPAVEHLLQSQQQDGSWPACGLYIDSHQNGVPVYAGLSSLTTAFCLEAINIYATLHRKAQDRTKSKMTATDEYYEVALANSKEVINGITKDELKNSVERVLARIVRKDSDRQILLLPLLVAEAFDVDIDKELLYNLSAVSLWGWMAYTTYDDFLDGEAERTLLPGANFCLRTLQRLIDGMLPDNLEFQVNAAEIMNRLDAANAWELRYCRVPVQAYCLEISGLPDYGDHWQLADRSLGHTIAGIGVLYAAGFSRDSVAMRALKGFLKHYLIARQLNDDAHDWEEDLRAGHINAVGVQLLQGYFADKPRKPTLFNLDEESENLRNAMWQKVILDICELTRFHTCKARLALQRAGISPATTQPLEDLLKPIEEAVEKSFLGREEALRFIESLDPGAVLSGQKGR